MAKDFTPGLSPGHYASFERRIDPGQTLAQEQRVLLIGQSNLAAAQDFVLTRMETKATGAEKFGMNSELDEMCQAAFAAFPGVKAWGSSCGGEGAVDIKRTLESLPEMQFTQIAVADNTIESIKLIDAHLETLWGFEKLIDGHAFVAAKEPIADVLKNYELVNNSQVTIMAAVGSKSEPWEWAACLAATVARYAWPPYKPFQTLPLLGLDVPPKGPSHPQRNKLLDAGISTFVVENGDLKIDRLVSTQRFANGVPDHSYRDLNKKMILSYIRFDLVGYLKTAFPRHGLARSGVYQGDVVSPDSIKPQIISRYKAWVRDNLLQDDGVFEKELSVNVASNQGAETLEIHMDVLPMGQFISSKTTISFSL